MNFFEIDPEGPYEVHSEAGRRWSLPGVRCDSCGETWANIGTAYPLVDLAEFPDSHRYEDQRPVTWDEFEVRAEPIEALLPAGLPVPPGTGLGPLTGHAEGVFGDLVWPYPWTLLLKKGAFDRLQSRGAAVLQGAPAQLEVPGASAGLIEIQIEPHGHMVSTDGSDSPAPCARCGRVDVVRPQELVVARGSVPASIDIFRLRDLTTAVLVSERLLEVLRELRLTGWKSSMVALE